MAGLAGGSDTLYRGRVFSRLVCVLLVNTHLVRLVLRDVTVLLDCFVGRIVLHVIYET